MVVDGNKPDTKERKNPLQIVTQLNVITPEPGEVLHDDAVDLSGFYFLHQPLETRPVKIRSAVSVIEKLELLGSPKLRIRINKIVGQFFLVRNALALSLFIVSGQIPVSQR